MSGLLGSGDLYFDRYSDLGASIGLAKVGNATAFSIKENAELKERISKGRSTYGQALDSVYLKQPAEISITIDEATRENLAMTLLGTDATVAAGAATPVTNQAFTGRTGKAVSLGKENLTLVTITNTGGITTYVLNTDYTLDARLGFVTVLAGGTITDGQALEADFTYTTPAQILITGSVKPSIRGKFVLDGKNQVTGQDIRVEVEATCTPTEAVDFLSDDFVPLTLEGKVTGQYTLSIKS